jgi:hypothetical protein
MKPRNPFAPRTYTLVDEITASHIHPMPADFRRHQLTRMWQGLVSLETAPEPSNDDWRVVSDAVNLMETFIREMQICQDPGNLLNDAVTAMAMAGKRKVDQGKPLRLDGPGIQATRAILEDYRDLLDVLPHRTVVRCHRMTERRIRKVLAGIKESHDVEVMDL